MTTFVLEGNDIIAWNNFRGTSLTKWTWIIPYQQQSATPEVSLNIKATEFHDKKKKKSFA